MKFEYKDGKEGECVAYMLNDSTIVCKSFDGSAVQFCDDGSFGYWDWDLSEAQQKFYPGDKITITF